MLYKRCTIFDGGSINTILIFAMTLRELEFLKELNVSDLDQKYVRFCVKNELGGRRTGCKS